MPQLFFYLKQLSCVDWETLVFYTCINPKCKTNVNAEGVYEEFGYVQFSEDFAKVQYSDQKSS